MTRHLQPITPDRGTVGCIGLGIMGRPMARNLVDAGYTVRVHNRSRPAVDDLADHGATAVGNAAEAADGADALVLMLPDGPDVEAVVLGDGGVAGALSPGATLIDMSTIAPSVARRVHAELAERGVHALDAPVSGGQRGAIDGTLAVMVGGDEHVFEAARPLLEVLGGAVNHVGPPGAGQVAKACNQIIVAGTIQTVAEALTLADRSGVDAAKVRDALLGGFAGSRILEVHGERMLDHAFDPGFKVRLHRKDLDIAMATGAEVGQPLLTTALVRELFGSLVTRGDGDRDHAVLARLVELLAGVEEA